MSKRRVYNGVYKRSNTPRRQVNASNQNAADQRNFSHSIVKYARMAYSIVIDNYVAIVTVVVVLLALLVLFPQTHKKNNDLDTIKKVLDHITKEVMHAEDACATAAEDICNIRSSICDRQTETTQELRDVSICTSRGLFEKRSETVQVEKKIGFFRRMFSLNRNVSRKQYNNEFIIRDIFPSYSDISCEVSEEIAIMSIVYTESFGALNSLLLK